MAKKPVLESEILACDNVPPELAARYLGTSASSVRNALRAKRAPYGYAFQNEGAAIWTFHISPGLLVAYQNGNLQFSDTTRLVEQIAADVEKVIEQRYKDTLEILFSKLLGPGAA